MAHLLHIDSSPRDERSRSRRFTREFVEAWKQAHSSDTVTYGYGSGERYETLNYQDPYLRTIFGFIGITDITFVHIENEEVGGTGLVESIANARTQITQLVAK